MDRRPAQHSMKRRSLTHDYGRYGAYHITMSVASVLRQPLGSMAGRADRPDGDPEAPHVELSPVGRMVEEELTQSIHKYYPMLEVQEYIIMPEHLHFILIVHDDIVSSSGRPRQLGHVLAGFKLGCNRRFWALTGQRPAVPALPFTMATESPCTRRPASSASHPPASLPAGSLPAASLPAASLPAGSLSPAAAPPPASAPRVLGDSVAAGRHPSASPLQPLFEEGFCDVMPVDAEQLATQRAYIRANPRSRLLRTTHRALLTPQCLTVDTPLSLPALRGYLARESPYQYSDAAFGALAGRLLHNGPHVACDSYGALELLRRPMLPVVCHRRDAALFATQRDRCLQAARGGAVLVSPRIAKGEQAIMDAVQAEGLPVVRILDNGFPERWHPAAELITACAEQRLLLLSPWSYAFRHHDEGINVLQCKTMNCIAQALCRKKDSWWKHT